MLVDSDVVAGSHGPIVKVVAVLGALRFGARAPQVFVRIGHSNVGPSGSGALEAIMVTHHRPVPNPTLCTGCAVALPRLLESVTRLLAENAAAKRGRSATLHGWRQISDYLGIPERTLRRYGVPVMPTGRRKGGIAVFTTTGVLDWWILGAAKATAEKRRVALARRSSRCRSASSTP